MKTLKEMLEARKAAADKMHELRETMKTEKRDLLTVEEQSAWDQSNADFDALSRQIDQARRMEHVEGVISGDPGREPSAPAKRAAENNEASRALAFQGWARFQMEGEMSEAQREACEATGLSPHARSLSVMLGEKAPKTIAEARALSTTTTGGGYTIPEGFVQNLEVAMLEYGPMLQVAEILRTATGNALPWPTANDTGNKGAQIDESTADATNVDPEFGVMTLNAYKYTSKIVLVPFELLQDSAFNMAAVLGQMLGERLGRIANEHTTTANGSDKPNGIVTAAALGVTADSASAITFDEILDLEHSVKNPYRRAGAYMMNDDVLKYVRKIKDGDGNYLWQMGNVLTGTPASLNGRPYFVNDDMAGTIEASAKTMIFGDLSKYKIRMVAEMRLKRLVERYAEYDQDGFVALMRLDGDLLNAGTNPVKYLIQASGS